MKKLLLLGWFCAVSLFAHPHVFLDTYVDVLPDKIDIRWVFDEMSSSMLMEDYDKNRDKKLDANEVAFMEKDHFKTLEPYSYFMHIFNGKEELDIHVVHDFNALFEKKKLIYTFSIEKPHMKKYELRFYDPEMFVALILKKKFLTCKTTKCAVEGYDADFYYAYKVAIQE
ncbi:DUF1007 family protein [Sulfurospirillum deleyianum]|uniref:ABC-type uncharacterized transport system periplasmic component-like protein n=1 Tax=Sulfurospirillum deleyianum (strain ATCC 51133 / DSM 6946 / 5175) TaxID=525898 RepID=D1B4N9_SULD5|nr:DUF1007 family protein [Sulfurospirillum deleyianum]ACZ13059.1 ABC-type uncharacterized transport system periplasmic component-like protein [Sulfurospirillum deleyianum DSM 6946]